MGKQIARLGQTNTPTWKGALSSLLWTKSSHLWVGIVYQDLCRNGHTALRFVVFWFWAQDIFCHGACPSVTGLVQTYLECFYSPPWGLAGSLAIPSGPRATMGPLWTHRTKYFQWAHMTWWIYCLQGCADMEGLLYVVCWGINYITSAPVYRQHCNKCQLCP